MLLVGDIGGTKTVLALFEDGEQGPRLVSEAIFPSAEHGSLEEILARFLEERSDARIETACVGVAGPVIDGKVATTNLPWQLDEGELARAVGARRAKILNDLEAAAYGMLHLGAEERAVLSPGAGAAGRGNAAVIAAGTGLGQAMLLWDGRRHLASASEGGHGSFAPRSEQQIELLRFLQAEFGSHVSYERVVSGPGLHNIYRFLRASGGGPEPSWLAERMRDEDPSAVIGEVGLERRDGVCADSLELFASVYGAEAGNLALRTLAVGGVFVGGGIAPKILPVLRGGGFMRAFTDKGRFSGMVEQIEVSVALNPRTPLIGAAHYAAQL
jgi:glucokinase